MILLSETSIGSRYVFIDCFMVCRTYLRWNVRNPSLDSTIISLGLFEQLYRKNGQTRGSILKNQQFIALLYGWIIVLALILGASLVLALLLRFTSFNEPTLSWATLGIGIISLFIGGLIAGIKGKSKGWIIGAAVGIGFTLFVFLVQYLGYKQAFSFEQSLHHLGYILAAIVGGVFGVNSVSAEH